MFTRNLLELEEVNYFSILIKQPKCDRFKVIKRKGGNINKLEDFASKV